MMTPMKTQNRTRVALVTGAARGIGFECARRLAEESVRCVLVDLEEKRVRRSAKELGSDHLAFAADVTKVDQVREVFRSASKSLGPINVVVNSAGIPGPSAPAWEVDPDEVRRVMEVNFMGTFLTSTAAIPSMIEQGWGRIVNIASIAGKEGNPNLAPYSSSKGAVIALTKSLGKELATKGVLVNAIAPAVIKTEILEGVSPAVVDYMVAKIPMGRLGQADEVAELVAYLASDRVSFSTGAVYDISGGRATY